MDAYPRCPTREGHVVLENLSPGFAGIGTGYGGCGWTVIARGALVLGTTMFMVGSYS